MQLSVALQGIVTQQLLPTADGTGRVVGCEILMPTPAVRNLIREGKSHQIYSAIQTSGNVGMQTMDAHLAQLVRMGRIDPKLAEQRASVPEELKRLLGGAATAQPNGGGMTQQAAPAACGPAAAGLHGLTDEHLRVQGDRRRRHSLPGGGGGRESKTQVTEQLRERGLIVLDVSEDKESVKLERLHRPLPQRQHAGAGCLLAPVRDADRLGNADAALALHARGPDRGRAARRGDPRGSARTSRPAARWAMRWSASPRSSTSFSARSCAPARARAASRRRWTASPSTSRRWTPCSRQIRSALMYPAFVFVVAVLIMLAVVSFIVPVFVGVFEELAADQPGEKAELPFMTQITVADLRRGHRATGSSGSRA